MLKAWLLNGSLSDIYVEEKYSDFVEESRDDQYSTMTLLQLEQIYGTGEDGRSLVCKHVGRTFLQMLAGT